jgi:ATP-binding cassette subfamily B protein
MEPKKNHKLRRLASYYKPYKGLFFADLFFAMLGAAVTLVLPLLVRYIMTSVGTMSISAAKAVVLKIGILMLMLILIQLASRYFITYYGHLMGAYIEHDMRNELFSHYQELSFSFFDDQKVGHLLSRVTSDLFDISELLHHGPEDILISVIKLFGAMIILSRVNLRMALLCLLVVAIMLVYALVFNAWMKEPFKNNRVRIGEINSQIEDSLAGIRVVKSFGNEEIEMEKFREGNQNFVKAKSVSYRFMAGYHSGMDAFTTLITVVALIAGAFFLADGSLKVTDLVTFLLYINNFTEPVTKLVNFTEQFQNGYSGYDRFLEMMQIQPDIVDAPDAVTLDHVDGEVCFENVSFHYQDNDETVLSNVSLDVKPGEYVALVGSSGAGKTTLCNLIPRFYDVTDGRILLDGQDIRKIRTKSLRANIGMVQQDVYLFAGTIMENIRYGKPGATDDQVIEAAKKANAHEFIMQMPDGYQTDIGQRGVKLSGGQKQRLSIARVFLKNPPILIFDEATSALDNESEKVVQESLEDLAKDRTTFVIAHRLSTIRNARRILVLTENGIEEEGTHAQLLEKNGIYARLCEAGL